MRFFPALFGLMITMSAPVRADVVCDWIDIAGASSDGRPVPPPLQDQVSRTAPPLVALAMFEITNSIDHRYRSYLGVARAPRHFDAQVAAAAGAHAVLVAIRPEQRVALDQSLAISLSSHADDELRRASIAWGVAITTTVLKRRLFEGPATEPYRPSDSPGMFAPPVPPVITEWSLRAQPFFLRSFDEVMPGPPPALSSARYARDFNETKRIGGVGQPGATPDSKLAASFLGGFNGDGMIHTIVDAKPRLVDRARFWALVRMAQHDSNAMTGLAKMRYMAWRPFNAIRNADRDDNPATERVANWTPVLATPNHPEYPCGHCIASGLIASLLSPETKGPVTVRSDSVPGHAAMRFADWPTFLAAASLARIQGGMHFRFSNETGQALGRRIGELALSRFAPRQ